MCSCVVYVCWSILGGLSGMLVGNRLEVIMVHNLPIIVVCTSFNLCSNETYIANILGICELFSQSALHFNMERGLQSVEGGEGGEGGERGNREREREKGEREREGG